jgi:hypothetical protein
MPNLLRRSCAALVFLFVGPLRAADPPDLRHFLAHEIIDPHRTMTEVQDYTEKRIPRLGTYNSAAEWQREADRLRRAMLVKVVLRGEAVAWRDAKLGVEWLETIPGGAGYHIKKLRYEALPGLWIPALLYEPDRLTGKVPAIMNVNGHDANGKAAGYKQIRCINQAKRGMLALNVEWFGMGQLRTENFHHGRMNQLELCGTSGVSPFYLSMKRGLDVLLGLEHTDPARLGVTGLSGGGWQTIFISGLDPRVTLANPVAGYSGYRTRIHHHKDLGDSEQTPTDMATVADYTHLTAMRAPHATLLTYNSKDDCCFEAGYALPPLMEAATPIFKLYGKAEALRSHVNDNPGTHNFEQDNRQALYRMLGDFFYPGDHSFNAQEIPCSDEVKTSEQLAVPLPASNANFHSLAVALSKDLPNDRELPHDLPAARAWQERRRAELRALVQAKEDAVKAEKAGSETRGDLHVTYWRLKIGDAWTVPAVEFVRGQPKGITILVNDAGRRADPVNVERLLKMGSAVLAVDPFYFGECKIADHDYLFALMLATVGERALGVQAGQLAAIARWANARDGHVPVALVAVGPRLSLAALVAAGLEEKAIAGVELHGALGSLKEIIEQNRTVEQMPEQFCFGLLRAFDIKQVAALALPRPVRFVQPSERARSELAELRSWSRVWNRDFDPLESK